MTRSQVRRRLAVAWWQQLALTLLPLLVISWAFGGTEPSIPVLALPLFVAGVASLFLSPPRLAGFKEALATTGKALDSAEEPAAWINLARVRRLGFLCAGLPAWVAALAVFCGLHPLGQCLLALCSAFLLYLYRIPSQFDSAA